MTEITLEYLSQLHKDLEARFPKPTYPNPADVGPQTYERIRQQCMPAEAKMIPANFAGIILHLRPDAAEGFIHPCTCRREVEFVDAASWKEFVDGLE